VRLLLFTQPGCVSCELVKFFLEAKELAFEERDVSVDFAARRQMADHGSRETPTLVIFSGAVAQVVVGFDPVRLDQLLDSTPSSDSVAES